MLKFSTHLNQPISEKPMIVSMAQPHVRKPCKYEAFAAHSFTFRYHHLNFLFLANLSCHMKACLLVSPLQSKSLYCFRARLRLCLKNSFCLMSKLEKKKKKTLFFRFSRKCVLSFFLEQKYVLPTEPIFA
jgi:hypothetical protein